MTGPTHRPVRAFVSAVLVCATAIVLLASPAAADSHWYYFQWNMWGNVAHYNGYANATRLNSVFDAFAAVGAPPAAISVQEICDSTTPGLSHYQRVDNHLVTSGYYGLHLGTLNPMHGIACNASYGIAAWIWHTDPVNGNHQFGGYYSDQGAETRGILCLVAGVYGYTHTSCSTHLQSNDIPTARSQQQEAYLVAENTAAVHPGIAHYFGGDLNLCYTNVYHATPHRFYNTYREANGMPTAPGTGCTAINGQPYYTWNALGSYSAKLDYSFGRLSNFTASAIGRYAYPESDHALIVGDFTHP